MNLQTQIDQFLSGSPHAVVGASRNCAKYGNKVLRAYLQTKRPVYAVNPTADVVEGLTVYSSVRDLPEPVHGISIITPPESTEAIVREAGELGIGHVWMQPGAESNAAIELAERLGMNVIASGPCLLVVLGFRD